APENKSPDIPLVPIPPPPVGRSDAKAGSESPPTPTPPSPTSTPPPAPSPPSPPPPRAVTARGLVDEPAKEYGKIDSYIARLTRPEKVREPLNPEEVMLFKFRKAPWSIYFKWLGKEGQGREVVYVQGKYDSKLHTPLAAGDVPFMPAG